MRARERIHHPPEQDRFGKLGADEGKIADVMSRRLTLSGSTLRPRSLEFKTMVADEIARTVWPYVEGGRLKPVIDSTTTCQCSGQSSHHA